MHFLQAKGYPDLSTRSFLRNLSINVDGGASSPPVFALMDFDIDGTAIMFTYKYGSYKLSHENDKLRVPSMQWLGVKSEEIHNYIDSATDHNVEGLLRLSIRDRKKALKMLEKNAAFDENNGEQEWRREIQVMLTLNVKAEMEIVAQRAGGVEAWVERKLGENIRGVTKETPL